MLKLGDFVIVTARGARYLHASELDDDARALLASLVDRASIDDGATNAATPHDVQVERALAQMLSRPANRWTVVALAKIAGLSRAAFARRFLAIVGAPPLKHLTALRMQIAAVALRDSADGLASIAASVGYASEFAFAKAFKRRFGQAPGAFRRAFRRAAPAFRARMAA